MSGIARHVPPTYGASLVALLGLVLLTGCTPPCSDAYVTTSAFLNRADEASSVSRYQDSAAWLERGIATLGNRYNDDRMLDDTGLLLVQCKISASHGDYRASTVCLRSVLRSRLDAYNHLHSECPKLSR